MLPLIQLLPLLVVSWASLRFIRRRFFPTVLENISGPPAESWATGSLVQLQNPKGWDFHRLIAENYEEVARTKGAFGADDLYVYDSKAMHHILVKDQHIYEETDSFIEGNKLLFGTGLLTALGDEHRRQRKMLQPVFSSAHIRRMLPTFYELTYKVKGSLLSKIKSGPQEIDVLTWTTRLVLELISQTGLGYSFDKLTENSPQHQFAISSKKLVSMLGNEFVRDYVMPRLTRIGTPAFRKFVVDLIPSTEIKELRYIINVLRETSVEIFLNASKKAAEEDEDEDDFTSNNGRPKDAITILMKANKKADKANKLTDKEVLSQITALTFGATDTTSGVVCRALHQLALNKSAQTRLREEIRNARKKNGGSDLTYDELMALPYLDGICRETLRLFPPILIVRRVVRQDTILPLGRPIRGINGDEIKEIPIPNGTVCHVSILASNKNPYLWGPDAEEWNPDRWLKPVPERLVAARIPGIYSHLMTFIGGGKSCVGFKFSQLELKVVLALLIEDLEFSVGDKEIIWQMLGIVQPNTDLDRVGPEMPMMISTAK